MPDTGSKLPSDFPVGLYPGARLEEVSAFDRPLNGKMTKGRTVTLMIEPAKSAKEIAEFYKKEFSSQGWTFKEPGDFENAVMATFAESDTGARIVAIKQDSMITVSVDTNTDRDRTKIDFFITKNP